MGYALKHRYWIAETLHNNPLQTSAVVHLAVRWREDKQTVKGGVEGEARDHKLVELNSVYKSILHEEYDSYLSSFISIIYFCIALLWIIDLGLVFIHYHIFDLSYYQWNISFSSCLWEKDRGFIDTWSWNTNSGDRWYNFDGG